MRSANCVTYTDAVVGLSAGKADLRLNSAEERVIPSGPRQILPGSMSVLTPLQVACTTMLCTLCRLVRRQEETRAQRGQMKQLKGLMHGLVNVTGDPDKQQLDAIRNARQLAFLITDLQDSTAMASANPVAFRKVQDIHDTVSLQL